MPERFDRFVDAGRITASTAGFKAKLFLRRAESSLQIAKHVKELEPRPGEPERLQWNYWAITIAYYSMLYAAKALILPKGYEVHDHEAAQVALAKLCVPSPLERDDLELLDQAHRIFEDEYVKYFEDARRESNVARYAAIKTYTQRRLDELYENARKFVAKASVILGPA